MPIDHNEALTREPFKPETWPVDADGFQPDLCTDCGTPVRYGSRHGRCLEPARAPGAQAAPAAVAESSGNAMRAEVDAVKEGLRARGDALSLRAVEVIELAIETGADVMAQLEAAAPAAAQPVAQEADNIPGLAADPSAFVRWAEPAGYDMTAHPLHFLFLTEKTAAARDGWNACRRYYEARSAAQVALPATPPALVGLSHPRDKPHSRYIDGYGYVSNMALDAIQRALAAANGTTLREGGNG